MAPYLLGRNAFGGNVREYLPAEVTESWGTGNNLMRC